jgi:peptidoglycan/LPS O-acetylase OafA/YrhL
MHRRRNFGLDLARALAISMVFLLHGVTACEPLGVGVDLFFVLSGFLIGRIYLLAQSDATTPGMDKPGSFTLWAFWSARWLRTLPPYFAALGLCALLQMHFHNNAVHWYYLLFLQNYAGVDGFGPSWSLCVEEHFYLALPLLGFIALRFIGRRHLLWLLPALALVPEILRSALPLPPDWFWRTHLHAEGLLLGVWLAYVFVDRGTGPDSLWSRLQWPAMLLALIPLATLAYQFYHPTQPLTVQHSVFYCMQSVIAPGCVCSTPSSGIPGRRSRVSPDAPSRGSRSSLEHRVHSFYASRRLPSGSCWSSSESCVPKSCGKVIPSGSRIVAGAPRPNPGTSHAHTHQRAAWRVWPVPRQ